MKILHVIKKLKSFMNKVILYQPWGGLGDNLQFSTLPKLYSEIGYEFYISDQNVYRNPEIKKLVWDLNPYVKGISNENPTIGGHTIQDMIRNNFIERIEESHGFKNTGNRYPSIYYEPNFINELENKTILSLGSISVVYDDNYINSFLQKMVNKDKEDVLQLKFHNELSNDNSGNFSGKSYPHITHSYAYDIYPVNDIFHHCDIIASCKRYITLLAGSSVLASAIMAKTNKKNTEVILIGNYINMVLAGKHYYFDNITYRY